MPDVTITAPMAADSIDRLTLTSCCPRVEAEGLVGSTGVTWYPNYYNSPTCMAEE
jgi:hypothetical protein